MGIEHTVPLQTSLEKTGDGQEPPFTWRRLLAPVDGVPGHEQGLQVAVELVRACAAELHLLLVVPTLSTLSGVHAATGRFLPGVTTELLELRQQEAVPHLRRYVDQIQDLGLSVETEIG
jgi:nucleotide-binding universal stress UspA family protein